VREPRKQRPAKGAPKRRALNSGECSAEWARADGRQKRIDELAAHGKDHGCWPISPDIVIELNSPSDDFADTQEKVDIFMERGSSYAVAIDPDTRTVVEQGTRPADLKLDCDAIIDT
jgi:hypothetical protein